MKRSPVNFSTTFSFMLFPVLYLLLKGKIKWAFIFMAAIAFICPGCFLNFYKTNTKQTLDNISMDALNQKGKYLIVHLNNGNFSLKNYRVNNNLIEADLESISAEHMHFLQPKAGSSPSYKKRYQDVVLTEIHLYALGQSILNNHISLPISSFSRIDIYEYNRNKTITYRVLSIVGLSAAAVYVGIIIAFAVTCNCPQVYTYDGNEYQFTSGVFSGAIYSSLEKTDYLPLDNLKDVGGKYRFRLMNNQQEEQYVNQLQLLQLNHDSATQVLIDRHGEAHTYMRPQPALNSSLKENAAKETFRYKDGKSYIFNEKGDPQSPFGNVIFTFDAPADVKKAKLIINAKNSLWSGFVFDEFSALFGNKYQKFVSKQEKRDREIVERWQKEQALPLMAYVQTGTGWQFIDYFALTGNTAGRDMIMSFDLPHNTDNKIRIKLESAFMFWDVDYAAMDFSADKELVPIVINPAMAAKSDAVTSEVTALTKKDDQYTSLMQNEFITTEFNKPQENNGKQSSYFLVSTGYYHSLKQYPGKAEISKLSQFRKKGSFTKYSENKFFAAEKALAKGINLETVKN